MLIDGIFTMQTFKNKEYYTIMSKHVLVQ